MTDTEAYRATLERLKNDRAEAVKKVNNLDAAIAAIGELLGMRGESTATIPIATGVLTTANGHRRDPRLATATMKDAALIALDATGKPMRIRELYDTLMSMGYPYAKGFDAFRSSMAPTLDRRPEFDKTGPGLYIISEAGKEYMTGAIPTGPAQIEF